LFSVIIPNRNYPELLSRALESVPVRDDLEVIIVDDDSDPAIMDFGNYPGSDRKNTKVILGKGGGGAGMARNVGLDAASGRWLLFLDSDDFFTPALSSVLDSHIDDTSDIIYFDITSVYSDTLLPSDRHNARSSMFARYARNPEKIGFYCRYLYTEPWGKMIRRDMLVREGIRFEETICANDYMFSVMCGLRAGKVKFDPSVMYCVTERKGSLSNSYFDREDKLDARLGVYWRVQQVFSQNGIRLYPFYGLWMMCKNKGGSYYDAARRFCRIHGISRLDLRTGSLKRIIRKRLGIGVPYCK